jgi:4-hydroxybenzoate polyprenyltransferase
MCLSTILVTIKATGLPVSVPGATLFTAGVVTAYTWDRWADCPEGPRPVWCLIASVVAAIVGLAITPWLSPEKIALAVGLGLLGLGYRRLKKFPLLKTGLIALAWAGAGVGFPVQPLPPSDIAFRLGVALFAVFAAGALLCDFKDVLADARSGVRTAQVLWGRAAAASLAAALAVAGVAVALLLNRPGLVCSGLVLAGLSCFPQICSRPVLGPLLVDGALALPAVFILSGHT